MHELLARGIAARVEPRHDHPTGACGGAAGVVVGGSAGAGEVRVDGSWRSFEFRRRGWRLLSTTVAPHMVESTLARDGQTVTERILTPPGNGLVLVQWLAAEGAVGMDIDLAASGALEVGTSSADGEVRVRSAISGVNEVATDRRAAVEVLSGLFGLVMMAPGAVDPTRALRRASGRAAGLAATLHRTHERGLRVQPADVQAILDRGRGALALLSVPGTGSGEVSMLTAGGMRPVSATVAIKAALAALALGDAGPATGLLDVLATDAASSADGRGEAPPERDPAVARGILLLFGMLAAWTGDLYGAARWRNLLLRAARNGAGRSAAWPPARPAVAVALAAAEAAGDAELAAELKTREPPDPLPRGATAAAGSAPWDARQGQGAPPGPHPADPAGALLSTLAAASPSGFGWPLLAPPDAAQGDLAAAAEAVLSIVHGRLGIEPDAARGRLRLRLDLTRDGISAHGIRAGDASADLEAARTDRLVRLRVESTAGGAPWQLLLEPVLAADRLVQARVDGVEAELSPVRPHPGLLRVPVQLAADAPRTLELELA